MPGKKKGSQVTTKEVEDTLIVSKASLKKYHYYTPLLGAGWNDSKCGSWSEGIQGGDC